MAIIGDLSITTEDGTVLEASTDLALAEAWAAHEYGATEWSAMSLRERNGEVAQALRALREAFNR